MKLSHLLIEIGEGKFVFPQLLLKLQGLLLVEVLLRLLNEGEHVAHAQDAAGHAVGVEDLDLVQLFAHAHKLDGFAGDRLDGQCRAPSGVAVQLGEHHAVDVQGVVKGLGRVYRVLADHGVHHQQDLSGLHRRLDAPELIHQLLVHVEPSGGVQEHQVVAVLLSVGDGRLGDLHRVGLAHLEHGDVQLFAHHLQLLNSGGAVDIAGGQQGALALLALHEARQLGAVGGLARALKAHHHHHGGGLGGDGQLGALAAHQAGELLVDDLNDLLGGGEGLQHVGAHRLLGDLGNELLDHLIAHVGLQQSQADLPHGLLHIGLGQPPFAAQLFKGGGELFGQSFKCHGSLLLHLLGQVQDLAGLGLQLRVVIPGAAGQNGLGGALHLLKLLLHGVEALDEAGLVLQVGEDGLRPDDHVPDALAGDAVVLGDLGQGQVLIIVEVVELLLPGSENVPVKIIQKGHPVCLAFHVLRPPLGFM